MSEQDGMSVCVGQDGKRKLCVGQLPGRKRPSLYMWDPLAIEVLAHFKSDTAARSAKKFLLGMVGSRVTDGSQDGTP